MIEKPVIIISSLGRTGTAFFGDLFRSHYGNVAALFEPESIHVKNGLFREITEAVRNFGFMNAVLGKPAGTSGVAAISHLRVSGRISHEQAAQRYMNERERFISRFNESVYMESSYQYYGMIDVLPYIFREYKALYVVRDPRDWVRSCMDYKRLYHSMDFHYMLGHRPTPASVNDRRYSAEWKRMDAFERLCWAWSYLNECALKAAEKDVRITIRTFEELFLNPDKHITMKALLAFLLDLKESEPAVPL